MTITVFCGITKDGEGSYLFRKAPIGSKNLSGISRKLIESDGKYDSVALNWKRLNNKFLRGIYEWVSETYLVKQMAEMARVHFFNRDGHFEGLENPL